MNGFEEKVAKYVEENKGKSKLNKNQIDEVVLILKEALQDENFNTDNVINMLMELHYSVTTKFFEEVFNTLDRRIKLQIIDKFMRAEKIVKNANNFGINRVLQVVNTLLQTNENDMYIHMVLKAGAKKAYGNDGGQKAGKLLAEICFARTQDKIYLLDYSTWEESELKNLAVWLDNAIVHTNNTVIINAHNKFFEKYNLPTQNKVTVASISKAEKNSDKPFPVLEGKISQGDNTKAETEHQERIFVLINELKSEALKMIDERLQLKSELEEIKGNLAKEIEEKKDMSLKLCDVRKDNEQLQAAVEMKEKELNDAKIQIRDLDERLKNSFNADRIRYNQELAALKNDLSKRLKPGYEDFIKLKNKELTPEVCEAILEIIDSVFHELYKKGIDVKQEAGV